VTVFSSSDSKKEEAMRFGATEFYNTENLQVTDLPRKLDHLIVTTSVKPDWGL
jgi:D-arabinose 1-dehydrogenase-like Zn-dependent alcohol dehydrogenase